MPRNKNFRVLFPAFCLAMAASACGDDVESPVAGTGSGTASLTGTETGSSSTGSQETGSTSTGSSGASTDSSGTTSGGGAGSSASGSSPSSSSSTGTSSSSSSGSSQPDYLWLEDANDPRLTKWIKDTNAASKDALEAQPAFDSVRTDILSMANLEPGNQLLPFSKIGDYAYTFTQSATNPRGIWSRISYQNFVNKTGNWEPLLDLDALAQSETQPWVWLSPNCLAPAGERCMLNLGKEGSTPSGVVREFDTGTKSFVTGSTFDLPAQLTTISWIDKDNVYISGDFGGDTTTNSGKPRTVRKLTRGAQLSDAPVIFEVAKTDSGASVSYLRTGGFKRVLATRALNAKLKEYFLLDPTSHEKTKLEVPQDSTIGFWGPWMICQLGDSDWSVGGETWEAGSVLVIDENAFIGGSRSFERLFAPTERRGITGLETVQNHILISTMENNKGRVTEWSYKAASGWTQREANVPKFGSLKIEAVSHDTSDEYFLSYMDFLTPAKMFVNTAGTNQQSTLLTTNPFFDASNLEIQQFFATSKDGTKIPYFQISKKGIELNSKNPTIVFGIGGFGIALNPTYRPGVGIGWLAKGGVYVVANIRGGGEFGPAWHQAAVKENRQRSFDDFIAVGEHLVSRKVTAKDYLGAHGEGNGGLVAGVMMTQRPDLWGAVVAQNPILDMQRFHLISGGASWITEYGNPGRAADLDYLLKYSPFHQVKKGTEYPPLLLSSRTINPQISPAHARKMMAKMKDQQHTNVFYYESTNDATQGGSTLNEKRAYNAAAIFTFFAKHLGLNQP